MHTTILLIPESKNSPYLTLAICLKNITIITLWASKDSLSKPIRSMKIFNNLFEQNSLPLQNAKSKQDNKQMASLAKAQDSPQYKLFKAVPTHNRLHVAKESAGVFFHFLIFFANEKSTSTKNELPILFHPPTLHAQF